MRAQLLILVAVFLFVPEVAQSQNPGRMCATSIHNRSEDLAGVASIFASPGVDSVNISLRQEMEIQKVELTDTIEVITDSAVCSGWMPVVSQALVQLWGSASDLSATDLGFYRIGPYVAVQVYFDPDLNPMVRATQVRTPLLIFGLESRQYIGYILR